MFPKFSKKRKRRIHLKLKIHTNFKLNNSNLKIEYKQNQWVVVFYILYKNNKHWLVF